MKITIIGGSGYAGGELIRELLIHPKVEISMIVSRTHIDEYVHRIHPNLRSYTDIKFSPLNISEITSNSDLVFIAIPHGTSAEIVPKILETGLKVIDLGADYRLKDPNCYPKWYGWEHPHPEFLKDAVYGLPELHREEIKNAKLVACPGCMSTATILALAPPIKEDIIEPNRIVVDAKIGSSDLVVKETCLEIFARARHILSDAEFQKLVEYASQLMQEKPFIPVDALK